MEHTQLCEKRILTYGFEFGGYCTHVQIDHNWAIKLPEGLDLKEAPPLLCAGVTVYGPLKRFNKIGAKCAVLGIGGLGHLAIQYANKLGMEVTAFTTRLENAPSLRQLGASDVQHSTDLDLLRQNKGRYDVVITTLFIEDALLCKLYQQLVKKGGVYIIVGAPNTSFAYPIDNQYLVDNEITLAGSFIGSIKDLNDMLKFSAKYGIKSINEYFSFEDFPKAFHRSELETPRYRCVINVTDWAKENGFDK